MDRFLSTSSTSTFLSPDQSGRRAIVTMSAQAAETAGNKFELAMQRFEKKERDSQALGQLASEKKRLLELAIPDAARNIQRAQLNTLNTLLGVQEGVRRQQESKEAKAYQLETKNSTELDFLESSEDIFKKTAPNGSGLFENTKEWWDNREKEIIENAPSEAAKMEALTTFQLNKTAALSDAIGAAGEMKNKYLMNQVAKSESAILNKTFLKPESFDTALSEFDSIAANLKGQGINDQAIAERKVRFESTLKNKQVEGYLQQNQLGEVKKLLSNEDYTNGMAPEKLKNLVGQWYNQGKDQWGELLDGEQKTRLQKQFEAGKLSEGIPAHKKFVEKQFAEGHDGILSKLSEIQDPQQRASMYVKYKTAFAQGASFIPKSEIQASESRILSSSDPVMAISESAYIMNLSRNPNMTNKFEGYGDEAIAKASYLDVQTRVLNKSPEQAFAAFDDLVNRSQDGRTAEDRATAFANAKSGTTSGTLADELSKDPQKTVDSIYEHLDQYFSIGRPGTDMNDTEADIIKSKYNRVLEGMFLQTGDVQSSVEAAKASIQAEMSITLDSDGNEVVKMNAPESMFKGSDKEYFDGVRDAKTEQLRSSGAIGDDKLSYHFHSKDGDKVRYAIYNEGSKTPIRENINGYSAPALLVVNQKGAQEYALRKERDLYTERGTWNNFLIDTLSGEQDMSGGGKPRLNAFNKMLVLTLSVNKSPEAKANLMKSLFSGNIKDVDKVNIDAINQQIDELGDK